MPLDVMRLRDSDLALHPKFEVRWVSVLSWCVAWHQVPAASLPDDDGMLSRMLGYGGNIRAWKKIRDQGALRGWQRHSDGRLYHLVVAAKALEAMEQSSKNQTKRKADSERLRIWREQQTRTKNETRDETDMKRVSSSVTETQTETRFVGGIQGQGQGPLPNTPSSPPGYSASASPGGGRRQRVSGFDLEHAQMSIRVGDPIGLIRAFGGLVNDQTQPEWLRDADGMPMDVFGAILWTRMRAGEPIRFASGLRKARDAWDRMEREDRRKKFNAALRLFGLSEIPAPAKVEVSV
jgi:hypothetical protein